MCVYSLVVKAVMLGLCVGIWIGSTSVDAFLQQPHRVVSFLTKSISGQPFDLLSRNYSSRRRRSQRVCRLLSSRRWLYLAASSSDDFVEAEDLEALQALFAKYCDKQGLMTKASVMQVPAIADLLKDGDLLAEEFNDIWSKAPKFPEVEASAVRRIDVDSFVQIYRDIDDLFEDEYSYEESTALAPGESSPRSDPVNKMPASVSAAATPAAVDLDEEEDEIMEAELESIFESLCDKNKLISKDTVKEWDEVAKLIEDGLLGEEEFEDVWRKTKKSPGSDDQLDVDGFLSFNVALDGLFEFDDDEMDDGELSGNEGEPQVTVAPSDAPASSTVTLIDGQGLSPKELFAALSSDSKGKLNRDCLMRWGELRDMLDEGDLSAAEFDTLFIKASKGKNELDLTGFTTLYQAIDELFEDDDDSEPVAESVLLKRELIETLEDLNDPDLLPCGLDCTESEQREILKLVSHLERQPSNLIRATGGDIDVRELVGSWDLLYSSSSAMRFNKGLSGLGGSFPNGKFAGLKQVLTSSKFVSDVEYIEHIEVNPSAASFDVTVTGDWELLRSVSLFTGEPSLVMTIEPGRVMYGPTSTKADHWKSLGPMNMLDVTYLDEDLRIMRGNTAVDTIFIFRRSTR